MACLSTGELSKRSNSKKCQTTGLRCDHESNRAISPRSARSPSTGQLPTVRVGAKQETLAGRRLHTTLKTRSGREKPGILTRKRASLSSPTRKTNPQIFSPVMLQAKNRSAVGQKAGWSHTKAVRLSSQRVHRKYKLPPSQHTVGME